MKSTGKGQALEEKVQQYIFSEDLKDIDPDVQQVLDMEDERQIRKIILIASESICPRSIRESLSSTFGHINAEGYPSYRMMREMQDRLPDISRQLSFLRDRRYYKGVEYVDFMEALAQKRIALSFATEKVKAGEIFVNVQPLSGAAANNAVYEAFLKPGDVVMGMDLTHVSHLTHGSASNRSGKNYCVRPYRANIENGEIDFETLYADALKYRPKLIIAGYSAYPRIIDWKKFREIADSCGAILLADIAHPAGLVVAGCFPNPIDYADVVSFTTHKTLCGIKGAVLLTTDEEKSQKIDKAVFPGEQGGPHLNTIAAKAVQFKIVRTEKFRQLQQNVLQNSKYLAEELQRLGFTLAYGGTDSHMCLIDMKRIKGPDGYPLKGEIASRILDLCGITCNKITIPGDTNPAHPGALQFGTTWISQRGFRKTEVETLARIIHRALTSMKPFKYDEAQGDVGRAKIPLEVMEETKGDVQKLIVDLAGGDSSFLKSGFPHYHSLQQREGELRSPLMAVHEKAKAKIEVINGHRIPLYYRNPEEVNQWPDKTALLDLSDSGLIEIWGERSSLFIEEIVAGNALSLDEGQAAHTCILDDEGGILDDVEVMKLSPRAGTLERYLIKTNPSRTTFIREYLRGLSDGYIIFDRDDLFSTVQGPVVIEDLRDCKDEARRLVVLGIYGKKADEIVKHVSGSVSFTDRLGIIQTRIGDAEVLLVRIIIKGTLVGYEMLVHPDHAASLWSALLEAGKESDLFPCGILLRDRIRQELGLPLYRGEKISAAETVKLYQSGHASSFDVAKPYFIGETALHAKLGLQSAVREFDYSEKEEPPLKTCLYDEHKKLTKKLVPFAGYTMPVWYSSINEEHRAVREAAGLFDVSHMGVLEIRGRDATRFLDLATSNYITKQLKGQSVYSYVLDPHGNVLDDIMIYRRNEEKYMLIVNAVNLKKIKTWFSGLLNNEYTIDAEYPAKKLNLRVEMRDLKDEKCGDDRRVDLALQGPRSLSILLKLMSNEEDCRKLRRLKRSRFFETRVRGMEVILSRTGYTGEKIGFELYVHPKNAVSLWKLLLEEGKEFGLVPTGLGARDSTRTQAGLPLYGHELEGPYHITPHGAGYGPFVRFHKPFFIGRRALMAKESKREMEIVRFRMLAKGIKIVKQGEPLVTKRGDVIGNVTSCVVIDGVQWGLAFVKKRYAQENTKVGVFILPRDKKELAEKPKDSLVPGDRLLLHEEAEILSRFPRPEETAVCKADAG